jgi:hypothetical protein
VTCGLHESETMMPDSPVPLPALVNTNTLQPAAGSTPVQGFVRAEL